LLLKMRVLRLLRSTTIPYTTNKYGMNILRKPLKTSPSASARVLPCSVVILLAILFYIFNKEHFNLFSHFIFKFRHTEGELLGSLSKYTLSRRMS
ncbi:hypothetical protein T12_8993, partial [Trichinella patagoniensis]